MRERERDWPVALAAKHIQTYQNSGVVLVFCVLPSLECEHGEARSMSRGVRGFSANPRPEPPAEAAREAPTLNLEELEEETFEERCSTV